MDGNPKRESGVDLDSLMSGSTFEIGAFVVLILGVLLVLVNPLLGGALVGIVFGMYFHHDILDRLKMAEATYQSLGLYKSIMILGSLAALIIALPSFFILAALAALVSSFVQPRLGKRSAEGEEIEVTPESEEE